MIPRPKGKRPFINVRFKQMVHFVGGKSQTGKKIKQINTAWRRGWDSNPRYGYPYNGFRDRSVSMGIGGRVNSRWLQAPDLDLFPAFSDVIEPCSV